MEQDNLCTLERCYKCSQYHCWYNRTEQEKNKCRQGIKTALLREYKKAALELEKEILNGTSEIKNPKGVIFHDEGRN